MRTSRDETDPAPVVVPAPILAAVLDHARRAYPMECCGYLRGRRQAGLADGLIACRNDARERTAAREFKFADSDLLAFAGTFRTDRPALVIYHSHPDGRAVMSRLDREAATTPDGRAPLYPVQHLIVAMSRAGPTSVSLHAWSTVSGAFVRVARLRLAGQLDGQGLG